MHEVPQALKGTTQMLRIFYKEEDGQGLAEYGAILVLVGMLCILAASEIGDQAIRLTGSANATLQSISS